MRTLVILLSFITVFSCSDDENTAIAPGEFRGELSGAVERKITADASFSFVNGHLFLEFRTGEINLPIENSPPLTTGVFLSVQWDESSGVFNIENSLFDQISYIDALTALEAQSGNITIDSYDGNILEGTVNINAMKILSLTPNTSVNITGEFIAIMEASTRSTTN